MPVEARAPGSAPLDCQPEGTAGIVLAAGMSSRLGRNKLLLEVGGEPLIRRSLRAALEAGLAPVVVVLGHEQELVERALEGLPGERVVNGAYHEGMRTSLQCGLRRLTAIAPNTEAAIVVLGDMPFVDHHMIGEIVRRYRASPVPIVASNYGPVTAPPILYERRLFSELLALEGNFCAKRVVRRHRDEAIMVDWPESRLLDIDVEQDYARLIAAL